MRFVSLASGVLLLSVVVPGPRATAQIDKGVAEPVDLRKLIERAEVLPPLSAAVREDLERRPSSWRGDLVCFDLERKEEVHARQPESRPIDLAEVLPKAKPAPMPSASRSPSSPSDTRGEALDEHSVAGGGAPCVHRPEQTVPARTPGQGNLPRQADGGRGEDPGRAQDRETTPLPGSYHVLTRYIVDGHEFCFVCEATPLGRGELLTAGHCVYQLDPNGDGNTGDGRWAAQAWVWPAGLEPSAALPASRLAAHQEWITRGALKHDVGVVTVPALPPEPDPGGPAPDH